MQMINDAYAPKTTLLEKCSTESWGLTSELLVVGWDHHRQLPGGGVVQAGRSVLLSRRRQEIFLLIASRRAHLGSDVCGENKLEGDPHHGHGSWVWVS